MSKMATNLSATCPLPESIPEDYVLLVHGEGGRASRQFLERMIHSRFSNDILAQRGDAAVLSAQSGRLAFTTDSFVVEPYFFPGGDIGKLAVCGTLNDLVVAGARPLWMSLSLILEEGFRLRDLATILDSVRFWSEQAKVQVVCGDTKVVPKGKADGIFINTSAIGVVEKNEVSGAAHLAAGDAILVSGPIGCHGMAIMAARHAGLVETKIESDCGLLGPAVLALQNKAIKVRAMRDATRGGVAAVLHEWAQASGLSIRVEEAKVPVRDDVRGMAELLGLDPLFVANEGTMLIAVPGSEEEAALGILKGVDISRESRTIGYVTSQQRAAVSVIRGLGRQIALDEPNGALLPRIC